MVDNDYQSNLTGAYNSYRAAESPSYTEFTAVGFQRSTETTGLPNEEDMAEVEFLEPSPRVRYQLTYGFDQTEISNNSSDTPPLLEPAHHKNDSDDDSVPPLVSRGGDLY